MKLLVVVGKTQFEDNGDTAFARTLTDYLNAVDGHAAELMILPDGGGRDERSLDTILAYGLLRIMNVDRIIAINFPAYAVIHPAKTVLVTTPPPFGSHQDVGEATEETIRIFRQSHAQALTEACHIFCPSTTIRSAVQACCKREGEILDWPDIYMTNEASAPFIRRLLS